MRPLKRIAAILLMGILFFNWYGYQLVSSYLETRADKQLEASIDENKYDDSQLISIKVPTTYLSYYNSSSEYQRVDGRIEVGGVEYKYVKRRLYNDSLELLCIPNHTAMHLQTARNEFFKLVNDLQQHNGGKKSNSHPNASKSFSSSDYDAAQGLLVMGDLYSFTLLPGMAKDAPAITSSYIFTAEQPPDHSSAHC